MEVFTKFFRRLVVTNASQIWHNARTDSSGSYPVLLAEVQKVATDPQQAAKIVEAIEFGDRDGDVFKDFDMSTFMDHFQLKTVGKFALASAFKKSSKADQRAKADGILKNNIQPFLNLITDPRSTDSIDEPSPAVVASIIDHIAQYPPRDWLADNTLQFRLAVKQRYRSANVVIPIEIQAALLLFDLLEQSNSLVKIMQRQGSRATDKLDRCKSILEGVELQDIGYQQVANVLLFMAIAGDEPAYNMGNFIAALREHRGGQRLDWQDVIGAFDREGVKVTRSQFKRLYDALIPLALEYENFDMQQLWGGNWRHSDVQLSFVSAFLSFTADELDATTIPRLRPAFTLEDFQDAGDDIQTCAATAVRSPFVSLDGTRALFEMVFRSSDTYNHAQQLGVVERVINPKMDLFVASVSAVPKPWGALQDQAVRQLMTPFFLKTIPGSSFVFHILWKRDKLWTANQLKRLFGQNPAFIERIFDHAVEHDWLEQLISMNNDLSLDLAALAHGQGLFDLEQWLGELSKTTTTNTLLATLGRFLKSRAQDDSSQDREQPDVKAPALSTKTVYTLLTFLGDGGLLEDELIQLQRDCLHTYPRLINYGEGFDDIIDANSKDGLSLPSEAEEIMQKHYEKLYGNQVQVKDILSDLEKWKCSRDPKDQELYASMIFGLFDEYTCFSGYPMSALAVASVLFGGIINCNLLSRIALKAALAMVLESVRDYTPPDSMFKFGLQALLHFKDRLSEWRLYSERLLQIPAILETEVGAVAMKVLQENQELTNGETVNSDQAEAMDDLLHGSGEGRFPDFGCLAVDGPLRDDYEDPSEQAQNNITFTLNNLSDRNLDSKFPELRSNIDDQNKEWLAHCLVDGLVKTQPNNQKLYMSVVDQFQDRDLWVEVFRQTFICSFRLLNSEKTIDSSGDRTSLKNLADWLGSITLARNRPIKHRNISFKELLIEAHDTERLALAIPFTCRTLTGAAQSEVFRPPCAWTMDIVEILLEIKHHFNNKIKTQHIFEIEKLISDLGLVEKDIQDTDSIRSRPPPEEVALNTLTDGPDGFGDLAIARLVRSGARAERLSPALLPDPTEVSNILKHNYTLPSAHNQIRPRVQSMLAQAVVKAIQDIIEPVVERSITIAAISASQLISKDFALEPDGERYESSAHTAVRCLAGNLALVTCKEPLRSSIAQNARSLTTDHFGEHVLTEGNIVMFVNDNLDAICTQIQKAAENASLAEVDYYINSAVQARKNGNYAEPQMSSWAYHVPDPFKPTPGGLNREQLAIYEDFGRTTRTNVAQTANASQEGPRQLPDVLQDQYGAMPNIPTSAENAAMFRQGGQPSQAVGSQQRGAQPLVNGYGDGNTLQERMNSLHDNLLQSALAGAEEGPGQDLANSPSVVQAWQSLRAFIQRQAGNGFMQEKVALSIAERFMMDMYNHEPPLKPAAVDVLARVLMHLSELSELTNKEISTWIHAAEDRLSNAVITVAYLKAGLVDTRYIDNMITPALQQRNQQALTFFADVITGLLLNDPPVSLRADFAHSLAEFGLWSSSEPTNDVLQELSDKLNSSASLPMDAFPDQSPTAKEMQIEYTFEEWTRLQSRENSSELLPTFLLQLHKSRTLATKDDHLLFLRVCLEDAIAFHEEETRKGAALSDASFIKLDSLAKLVVLMVAFQGKLNGSVKLEKGEYFWSIMTTFVLMFVKHQSSGANNTQRMLFRILASVISEIHSSHMIHDELAKELTLAVAKSLGFAKPQHFPSFAFAFLDLLSHRTLMPTLLRTPSGGWKIYSDLLLAHLSFACDQVKPHDSSRPAKELFRGTIELFLVLHHDFPEFLAKHHFQLLESIPPSSLQLRSLIISATPANSGDVDETLSNGLNTEAPADHKSVSVAREEVEKTLESAGIQHSVEEYVLGSGKSSKHVQDIIEAVQRPEILRVDAVGINTAVDTRLLHAIVLRSVLQVEGSSPVPSVHFNPNSPRAALLDALVEKLDVSGKFYLISSIADQLRWMNPHTTYFGLALLHIFRERPDERMTTEIQTQVVRVLLERLVAHRPHPWGLMATMEELLKNRQHRFWDLAFVKASPEVQSLLARLFG